jgi:hypothetical protein
LTLVGATPLAAWFLLGQLRERNGADYIFRVPEMNRSLEVVLGIVVLAVAGGAAGVLWRDRDWLIRGGWWRVYVRLLVAGVAVAAGARIVTAASGGANIGGGFILFFGPVPVLYLLERAVQEATHLRSPETPPGWRPSAFEWLVTGGGGIALKAIAVLCTAFLAVVLVPTPALIAVGVVVASAWLIRCIGD